MTEQRTSVIEAGDEIKNHVGQPGIVDKAEVGKHGILISCHHPDHLDWTIKTYAPFEFPAESETRDWYNWFARMEMTLPSGAKLGCVSWAKHQQDLTIQECDAEWQRTIDAMRTEEMQSRPTEIRLT